MNTVIKLLVVLALIPFALFGACTCASCAAVTTHQIMSIPITSR